MDMYRSRELFPRVNHIGSKRYVYIRILGLKYNIGSYTAMNHNGCVPILSGAPLIQRVKLERRDIIYKNRITVR